MQAPLYCWRKREYPEFFHTAFNLAVPWEEFALYFGECDVHLFEEDEQVIDEVGGFIDEAVAIAVNGLYGRFNGLLSHFLGYFFHAFDKELGGVGIFRHLGMTLLYEARQRADETVLGRGVEACLRAAMACRADRDCLNQQRVAVAVGIHILHFKEMPRGLPFCPKFATCAAEECDAALGHRLFKSLLVHVAEHKHFEGHGILYDDGQQTVGTFIEIEI